MVILILFLACQPFKYCQMSLFSLQVDLTRR